MAFNYFMHPRNVYKERPDFSKIARDYPEFEKYVIKDEKGRATVDFTDTESLRAVTKILLKKDFDLDIEIPSGFLIPTVPQRLNYILWIEDLLAALPKRDKSGCIGIDIGTGPCAVFSLLGARKNSWKFVSTETSVEAIQWAKKNIQANNLENLVKLLKVDKNCIFGDILRGNDDVYDFCLCNPPFYENIEEIKKKNFRSKESIAETAQKDEILAEGGEVAFVEKIIRDSLVFKDRICLYTSMFGKKKSFQHIWKELQKLQDVTMTKTQFCQGNTIRWGIAWTFLKPVNFEMVKPTKVKNLKKTKPPLLHKIYKTPKIADCFTIKGMSKVVQSILAELEILLKVVKIADNYAEILMTSDKNTWSHQRRKRREQLKAKEHVEPQITTESNTDTSTKLQTFSSNVKTTVGPEIPQESPDKITLDVNYSHRATDLSSMVDITTRYTDINGASVLNLHNIPEKSKTFEKKLKLEEENLSNSEVELNTKHVKLEGNDCFISETSLKSDSNNDSKTDMCQTSGTKHRLYEEDTDSEIQQKQKRIKLESSDLNSSPADLIPNDCIKKERTENFEKDLRQIKSERDSDLKKSNNLDKVHSSPETLGTKHRLYEEDTDSEIQQKRIKLESSDLNSDPADLIPNDCIKKERTDNLDLRQIKSERDSDLTKSDSLDKVHSSPDKNLASFGNRNNPGKRKVTLKLTEDVAAAFEPKSLLFSRLKLRREKEFILLEMNCPPDYDRETLHQIFQLLKNKIA